MRFHQLFEAPLADFDAVGDLDREGSFRPEDLRAIKNPKWREKVFRAFERTPFNFNIYVYNAPEGIAPVGREIGNRSIKVTDLSNIEKYAGIQSLMTVANIIGKIPPNADQSITVLLVENEGANRIALTPWILAHRVGHAIMEGNQQTDVSKIVSKLYEVFGQFSSAVMSKMKRAERYKDRFHDNDPKEHHIQVEYRHFDEMAKIIGTFRSARMGKLNTSGEFVVEMMAQFMIQGKITFNRPELDDSGRTAPLDPSINKPLFDMAKGERKADFLLKVLKKEFWRTGKGFPAKPFPHYVAYDENNEAVASSTEDRSDRWRPLGWTTKVVMPTKAAIRKYQAMQDRQEELAAMFDQWARDGLLFDRQPTATDDMDYTLTSYETRLNTVVNDVLTACVGKAIVL